MINFHEAASDPSIGTESEAKRMRSYAVLAELVMPLIVQRGHEGNQMLGEGLEIEQSVAPYRPPGKQADGAALKENYYKLRLSAAGLRELGFNLDEVADVSAHFSLFAEALRRNLAKYDFEGALKERLGEEGFKRIKLEGRVDEYVGRLRASDSPALADKLAGRKTTLDDEGHSKAIGPNDSEYRPKSHLRVELRIDDAGSKPTIETII